MTKSEAAIVAAYTGVLIGKFSDMHEYVERKLGHPIWTHQFPEAREDIKKKTKEDFVNLEIEDEE